MASAVLAGIMHVNDQEESFAKVRAMESGRSNPTNIFNIHNSLAPQRVLSTCCGHLRTRSLPRGPINSASPLVSRVQTPFETCLMSLSIYWLLRAQARAWSQAGNRAWTATQHSCFISLSHCVRHLREDCAKRAERYSKILVANMYRLFVLHVHHVYHWGTFRNALNALQF